MKRQAENSCAICEKTLDPEFDFARLLCGHDVCLPCTKGGEQNHGHFKQGCHICNRWVKTHRREESSKLDRHSIRIPAEWSPRIIYKIRAGCQNRERDRYYKLLKAKITLAAFTGRDTHKLKAHKIPKPLDIEEVVQTVIGWGFKVEETKGYGNSRDILLTGDISAFPLEDFDHHRGREAFVYSPHTKCDE